MAFTDHLEDGLIYYLRISGIPYVFCNHDLPAAWLTGGDVVIGGESYTPSKTLLTSKGFTYKNSIEAKSGLGKSSGMTVHFLLDDTWLDLTSIHIYRAGGKRYTIMGDADVVPGATTIPLDSTSGASPADELYAGLETMEVDSIDTSQTLTASRGLYDSQERRFAGFTDGALETGSFGAWAIDHPGAWEGRTVQIWMGTGEWRDGLFVPYGATIESAEDKRIFVGTISKLKTTSDTERVKVTLQSLDRLIEQPVAFRMPTFDAGHRTTAQVPVDGESDYVSFSIAAEGGAAYEVWTPLLSSGDLPNPHGMIPIDTLLADIAYTIKTTIEAEAVLVGFWVTGITSVSFTSTVKDNKLTLNMTFSDPVAVSATYYWIQIKAVAGSVWRQLGFTGLHSAAVTGKTLEDSSIDYTAQRKLPWLYISRAGLADTNQLRLWFTGLAGPALDMDPGWDKVDGSPVPAYVRIDGEVFEVDAVLAYSDYGTDWFYMTTTGRAKLGSRPAEHYIEAGEDVPDGVQLIAFSGMDLPKAWLALIEGGSGTKAFNHLTYDQGWYGAGAYVDSQWVDEASFEAIATSRGIVTDNLAAGESTSIRDLIQGDCIAQGLSVVAGPDGLKLLDVYPPSIADVDGAVIDLDETNCRTIGKSGIELDLGEDKLVNDCLAHIRYNNGTGEFGAPVQMIAADSIGTYGRKPRLEMRLRAFGGAGSAKVARTAMQRIQDAYKAPYAVIVVKDITHQSWWAVELGDIVTISHTLVPTISNGIEFVTPGRGISRLPARVMAITKDFPNAKKFSQKSYGGCVLVVGNISDTYAANWSPSAYCSSSVGAICTITPRYGGNEGAEFKPDDLASLRHQDGSTIEPAEINSAVTGTIILKAPPTIVAPFIIEPRRYTEALQDAQRFTAFGTNGDHLLNAPGTTHLPRIYR